MKKLLVTLVILTLTGCSISANGIEKLADPPAVQNSQQEKQAPGETNYPAEPVPEEPSKPAHDPPVKEESVQDTVPTPEQPKPVLVEQSMPDPTSATLKPHTQQQPKQIDLSDWVEYHTDDIKTLSRYLNEDLVILYNNKYYASPKLQTMLGNLEVIYENDVSTGADQPEGTLSPDAEFEIVE